MSAPKIPAYRRHKAVGQAYVNVDGRQVYLGKFDSPESHERYRRIVAEICSLPAAAPRKEISRDGLSIVEVAAAYWLHATVYYTKDGQPSGQLPHVRVALRVLRDLYGETPAADFGPLKLKAIQQHFIAKGLARRYINGVIGGIRRVFRWAVAEELIDASIYHALAAVPGLKIGRTAARETEPIAPVDDATVALTLPYLPAVLADMVRLQRLCGCRPQEVSLVRPCDLDTSGEIWLYTPHRFKTQHHGRTRTIFIGPRAQEILRPYLLRKETAYCFSAAESRRQQVSEMRARRKTRVQPSQADRGKDKPARKPGDRYTKDSYSRAVARACAKAKVTPWRPNQLRHAAATEARRLFGLEAAQVLLGHAKADTTAIYAAANVQRGVEIARMIG
jgi:integrase